VTRIANRALLASESRFARPNIGSTDARRARRMRGARGFSAES
jgi:hypothetical protein